MKKIFILLFLALLISACQKNKASEGADLPAQRAENVFMQETSSGIAAWQLKATSADFYDNRDIKMANPKIVFNSGQKDEATLIAKNGSFKENIITFTGKVTVTVKEENTKLNTEKLFYNTVTKVAWTNVPFILKRGGITVKGKALKADNGFSNIEIFNQVTDLPSNLESLKVLK